MDIEEALDGRRTVRIFQNRLLEKDTIKKIIEDGMKAPSSMNNQPWRFIVTTGEKRNEVVNTISRCTRFLDDVLVALDEEKRKFVETFFKDLGGAPVLIIVVMPKSDDDYNRKTNIIANGAAVQNMQLSAHSQNIGACCLTSSLFVEEDLKELLNIDEEEEIVTVMLFGYPDESPPPTDRDLSKIIWMS